MGQQEPTNQHTELAPVVCSEALCWLPLACQIGLARVWSRVLCWSISYDSSLAVGLYAALHRLKDNLESAVQGQEVGFREDRGELVF